MSFASFLQSLSESERDFIAGLDYGDEAEQHRRELDRVILQGGKVNFDEQWWHPYEPVKLGVWQWVPGHEREFVACCGIILTNMATGEDTANEWDYDMRVLRESWEGLLPEYRSVLSPLVEAVTKQGEPQR
jgi:hypothetical protein